MTSEDEWTEGKGLMEGLRGVRLVKFYSWPAQWSHEEVSVFMVHLAQEGFRSCRAAD